MDRKATTQRCNTRLLSRAADERGVEVEEVVPQIIGLLEAGREPLKRGLRVAAHQLLEGLLDARLERQPAHHRLEREVTACNGM